MQPNNPRRASISVRVGNVQIGGQAPIVVQSMTNTDTADVEQTARQCYDLWRKGSELVRVTVDRKESAMAIPAIVDRLIQLGWSTPHLIGDFHYIGHKLLTEYPDCAQALVKYRINPGNVGFGDKQDKNFATMIEVALKYNKPVRIGVNWGSLDEALLTTLMDQNNALPNPLPTDAVMREAVIQSALMSAKKANELGMSNERIVLACKTSRVPDLVAIYQSLATRCDNALHLGLTEAGMDSKGIIATASAFAILLQQGIGDTIRASLTPEPGGDRTREVQVCQEILQALGLRAFMPMVSACPGCGRTTSQVFQVLAQTIQQSLRTAMPEWRLRYPGVENMTVAVMGCVVNGPGESKHANIGISLPGTGEEPAAPVFIDGKKAKVLRGPRIAAEFMEMIRNYVESTYSPS